jgi:ABC-type Co2+ transport system permease subunit
VQHGGLTALGVNSCDMVLPALLVCGIFTLLERLPFATRPWFRATLVMAAIVAWLFCLIYDSVLLLSSNENGMERAQAISFHPLTILAVLAAAGVAAWVEHRLENAPEFALGLLCGLVAVLSTALLTSLALAYGGIEPQSWRRLAEIMFVVHLPVALVEGIVLGFTVSFLARVKPEMLGRSAAEQSKWITDPLP